MRILISRPDKIGDVVLTLPLAAFLKTEHPDCMITFLCSGYTEPLVRCCADVDDTIRLEDLLNQPESGSAALLSGFGFDAILHVLPHRRIARIAAKARIPLRIGTIRRIFHWSYCNRLIWLRRSGSSLHETQLNLKLTAPLTHNNPPPFPLLHSLLRFRTIPLPAPENARHLSKNSFNLVLNPSSGGSAPCWPVKHYVELAKMLSDRNIRTLVTCMPAEAGGMSKQFEGTGALIVPIQGLSQFISFIAASDGLAASSTGPLHLAAAFGKRALGLYRTRPPLNPERWGPVGIKAQTIAAVQPSEIKPHQVFEVVSSWL